MTKRLLLLALPLLAAACATNKWMMSRPLDNGLKAVYSAPFDKVKRAAYDSLGDTGFTVKTEKWDERSANCYVISSSKGLSAGSTGQYARIVIEKTTDAEQTVYVMVESKAATRDSNAADDDASKGIQGRIEKRVTGK